MKCRSARTTMLAGYFNQPAKPKVTGGMPYDEARERFLKLRRWGFRPVIVKIGMGEGSDPSSRFRVVFSHRLHNLWCRVSRWVTSAVNRVVASVSQKAMTRRGDCVPAALTEKMSRS